MLLCRYNRLLYVVAAFADHNDDFGCALPIVYEIRTTQNQQLITLGSTLRRKMNYENFDLFLFRHNKHQNKILQIQPHKMMFCELTICLSGKLEYRVDNNPVTLGDGDIIFIAEGQQRSRNGNSNYADYVSFNFRCTAPIEAGTYFPKAVDKEIRLLSMCCDESFAERGLNDNLTLMLQAILNKLHYLQIRPNYCDLTMAIIRVLQQKVYEKITLEQVSRNTFFSAAYCRRVFKKDTGKSIVKYFNELKIEEAKALMIQGGMTLVEISEKLGFDDYNYFSRLFKKECGYSPMQYLSARNGI